MTFADVHDNGATLLQRSQTVYAADGSVSEIRGADCFDAAGVYLGAGVACVPSKPVWRARFHGHCAGLTSEMGQDPG